MIKEVFEIVHRLREHVGVGEHYDAEAEVFVPVKAAARDDKDIVLVEELHREILPICKVKFCFFNTREEIERCAALFVVYTINFVKTFHCRSSLLVKAAARHEHFARAFAVDERGGNDELSQRVATQAHRRELHDAVLDFVKLAFRAGKDHPAASEAADYMALRETVERYARKIGRDGADRFVTKPVHDKTIVDLIGEYDEVVFPCDIGDSNENLM